MGFRSSNNTDARREAKKRKRESSKIEGLGNRVAFLINAVKDDELPTLKKLNFSTSELKDCSDTLKVKLEPHTLIHLAAKYNSADVLEYFVKKKIFKVDELVKNQSTPLHQAAHHGKLKVLEKLIRLESNPWLRTKSDYLPIHNAILRNQDKVVEILLNYMSKKNPSKKEITFERIRVPPSKQWKKEHTEKLKGFIEKVFSPNAVSQK
jgi:ankyrin repeat protein